MIPKSVYDRIYTQVRRIPRGRVATYGQIARLAGLPGQARRVGNALYAHSGPGIPWHRVLNAHGELSLARLDAGAALDQKIRLEAEGVRFGGRGRVNLDRYQWRPKIAPADKSRMRRR